MGVGGRGDCLVFVLRNDQGFCVCEGVLNGLCTHKKRKVRHHQYNQARWVPGVCKITRNNEVRLSTREKNIRWERLCTSMLVLIMNDIRSCVLEKIKRKGCVPQCELRIRVVYPVIIVVFINLLFEVKCWVVYLRWKYF